MPSAFARLLSARIAELGISQREAARRSDVVQQTISLILSGVTDNPEDATVRALTDGLELNEQAVAHALATDRANSFLRQRTQRFETAVNALTGLNDDELQAVLAEIARKKAKGP